MKWLKDEWVRNPKTLDDVLRCLNGSVRHPAIAFYYGSKFAKKVNAKLIRETVRYLREIEDVPKYTKALALSVKLGDSDHELKNSWFKNIDDLRVLFHASPVGTERQKSLLIEVAKNKALVKAMRIATREEKFDQKAIEPTWLAVFSANAAKSSVQLVKKVEVYLQQNTVEALHGFLGKAK